MDDDKSVARLGYCSLDVERRAVARNTFVVNICWLVVGVAILWSADHLSRTALVVAFVGIYTLAGVALSALLRYVRDRSDSIDAVADALRAWRATTFVGQPPEAVAEHLLREVHELQQALYDRLRLGGPVTAQAIVEETADVLILGLAMCDLIDAPPAALLRHKFGILERRRWSPPDSDGVIEHDRSQEDTHE